MVDQTTETSCGSYLRQMQLRVVTKNGRTVTGVSVGETFPEPHNTCNSFTITLSGCAPADGGGTFQDATSVGCPITDSSCGFASNDRWQWCAPTNLLRQFFIVILAGSCPFNNPITLHTYQHVLPAMRKDVADRIGALLFGSMYD
jgi:hypothetical protein